MLHYLSFGENGCKEIFHFGNCPLQPEYRPKFTSQKEYTLTDPFLLSAWSGEMQVAVHAKTHLESVYKSIHRLYANDEEGCEMGEASKAY